MWWGGKKGRGGGKRKWGTRTRRNRIWVSSKRMGQSDGVRKNKEGRRRLIRE